MLSLNHRPLHPANGTLLISLSSGRIQVWSHHHTTERYITDFNAIHVAGDVSKWLIDVHFACWSWCIQFFYFLFSPLFSLFESVCSFSCSTTKKQNNFVFNNAILFFSLPPPHPQPTLKNVSHSNDNRHSKLLFIHGLSKRIHKNLDDCQLLVCFQLRASTCYLVTVEWRQGTKKI